MAGQPPDGVPVPADGSLPEASAARLGAAPFGVYVHVPFCLTRCGYCDFNTYTAAELGSGASRDGYPALAIEEIRLAARVLRGQAGPVQTVFFGGGTPTLLPPGQLAAILRAIDAELGIAPGAEVTAEANPETIDARSLGQLRDGGVTRLSIGMQSAVPHVLAVLERVHEPGRPERCVAWARAAGFDRLSLDLIYGTPGESDADWKASLDAALAAGPDHISAYSLIVEDGTRLAARIRRGELPAPDDDVLADRYLMADDRLAGPASRGTRCPTGRRVPAPGAGTTSSTGRGVTGGASGRVRTATWPGPAGGTYGIRPLTRAGSASARAPVRPGKSSPRPSRRPSGSCWLPGWRRAARSRISPRQGALRRDRQPRTD